MLLTFWNYVFLQIFSILCKTTFEAAPHLDWFSLRHFRGSHLQLGLACTDLVSLDWAARQSTHPSLPYSPLPYPLSHYWSCVVWRFTNTLPSSRRFSHSFLEAIGLDNWQIIGLVFILYWCKLNQQRLAATAIGIISQREPDWSAQCLVLEICAHTSSVFLSHGEAMYESAGRDQISNLPADFRQLSIAWILTITRSKSAATAHGALLSKHL